MLSAQQFKDLLFALLNTGDRRVSVDIDTRFANCTMFVKFINLPLGRGDAGGGAERENNRALFSVTGFTPDPSTPVARVQVSQITSVFDTKLRKKTGDPNKIAVYLADHINALVLAYEPKLMA